MNESEAKEYVKKAILTGNKVFIQKVMAHYETAYGTYKSQKESVRSQESLDLPEIAKQIGLTE
jgi:hypothetical protein